MKLNSVTSWLQSIVNPPTGYNEISAWVTNLHAAQDRIGELAAENMRLKDECRAGDALLAAMTVKWREAGTDLDVCQRDLEASRLRQKRLHDQVAELQQALGSAQHLIASMMDQRPGGFVVTHPFFATSGLCTVGGTATYDLCYGLVEDQNPNSAQLETAEALDIPAFLSRQDERTEFDIWAWLTARKASHRDWWSAWLDRWRSFWRFGVL